MRKISFNGLFFAFLFSFGLIGLINFNLFGTPFRYGVFVFVALCAALVLALWISGAQRDRVPELLQLLEIRSKGDLTRAIEIPDDPEWVFLSMQVQKSLNNFENVIRELEREKTELRGILSSMVEGVLIISKDAKITLISAVASDMLGVHPADAMGRSFLEVIRNQNIITAIKEVQTRKIVVKEEFARIIPREQYFSIRISPVMDERGRLVSITAVFHDITELKKLERLRSEFVSNVSHELKTPLTSIKGFVETLKEGALKDPAHAQRFLDIILKHTKRLEDLVNDILNLSAIESKEFKLNKEAVPPGHILKAVLSFYRNQLESKRQQFSTDIPVNIPNIIVDVKKIEQVFSNLLDNAIKYTPAEGKISITAKTEGKFVRVDVTDSGIGIAQDDLPRLFERFYRVNKDRSREMGGTGLGLAIVKHIVQAHGGRIEVQSLPGKGSTFSVFLPASG